jgi:hypothetical protein
MPEDSFDGGQQNIIDATGLDGAPRSSISNGFRRFPRLTLALAAGVPLLFALW